MRDYARLVATLALSIILAAGFALLVYAAAVCALRLLEG